MITLRIPPVLRRYSGGEGEVAAEGETVRDVLEAGCRRHPELRLRVFRDGGAVHAHLRLFRNGEEAALADGVSEGDVVEIAAAAGGG